MCGFFMEENNFKNKISETVNMPKDVLANLPILKIWGDSEVYIENFKGILEYIDSNIRVQTKTGKIAINGIRLNIEYYSNDEMKITGIIKCIEYQAED